MIIIISVLITGALSVSVNVINNAKVKVTKDRLSEIYKALGNYVLSNKKLPCPASLTETKSGSTSYGTASETEFCQNTAGVFESSTSTNLVRGMIPVRTLGLSLDMAEDGFGSKFEYIVDKNYTIASSGTVPTSGVGDFGTSSTANIIIMEKPGSSNVAITSTSGTDNSNNNNAALFVILSVGANKLGAYGADSSSRNGLPTDAAELANLPNSTSDGTAYGSTFYISSGNSDVYDDVLIYKSRNSFVSDFNALNIIPCQATSETLYGGSFNWPLAWYNQVVSATSPTCASLGYTSGVNQPTKRCGAFGVWDVVINPCLQ